MTCSCQLLMARGPPSPFLPYPSFSHKNMLLNFFRYLFQSPALCVCVISVSSCARDWNSIWPGIFAQVAVMSSLFSSPLANNSNDSFMLLTRVVHTSPPLPHPWQYPFPFTGRAFQSTHIQKEGRYRVCVCLPFHLGQCQKEAPTIDKRCHLADTLPCRAVTPGCE